MRFKNEKEFRERLWETAGFMLKFAALSLPLYAVMASGISLEPFQELTARLSYYIVSIFSEATLNGIYIDAEGFVVEISADCTGWKSMMCFAALILATPSRILGFRKFSESLKRRMKGLSLLIVIYGVNILRVSTTVLVGAEYGREAFDLIHLFAWRFLLSLALLVLWLWWVKRKE